MRVDQWEKRVRERSHAVADDFADFQPNWFTYGRADSKPDVHRADSVPHGQADEHSYCSANERSICQPDNCSF